MSEPADLRRSSVSSVSLIEIKAQTHLVLQAFLERAISTPHKERPGSVGGAYDDHNNHSVTPQSKQKDGHDSQLGQEEEKKTGIKDLMKNIPHTSNILGKGSLGKGSKTKQSQATEESVSPSSSSDEDESEKRKKKKQAIKRKFASFFKKHLRERKEKEQDESHPQRPGDCVFPKTDEAYDVYDEMALKLEHIARWSTKLKTPTLHLRGVSENDDIVVQLVKLLSSEGDAINIKIQQDPQLLSSLNRLPYSIYEQVLDFFGRSQVTGALPSKPPASPTLQRIAISMEVSRRMVTATGTQLREGYAERYMDRFIPWVKSQGGWGKVLNVEKTEEWD